MRILVTGGCGFIGSNLVRLLVGRGHTVLNLDKLTYAGNRASLRDLEGTAAYEWLGADVADAGAVNAAFGRFRPEAVMHLAAESHVDRSIDAPGEFIQTNVVGTYTLLEAARRYYGTLEPGNGFRFLHVSTDEVYGSLGPEGAFVETTPYDPRSPYSASKAASDHLARAWRSTFGLPVLVTNCSNNYGPCQFPEKLIPVVILKALAGEPIPIYGQGDQVRDWLYVEDHAEALLTVLERGAPGATYNIGGENERRNIDLVHTLCGLLDELAPRADGRPYREQIVFVADRPGHDQRYAMDISRIRRELGWEPRQDHETGFRKTVRWYLENRPWWEAILSGEYRLVRQGVAPLPAPER